MKKRIITVEIILNELIRLGILTSSEGQLALMTGELPDDIPYRLGIDPEDIEIVEKESL